MGAADGLALIALGRNNEALTRAAAYLNTKPGAFLWVPRTVSRPLISAFAASRPRSHGSQAAQQDRTLWPFDSPTCCSPA